jgi:hypothetical protein
MVSVPNTPPFHPDGTVNDAHHRYRCPGCNEWRDRSDFRKPGWGYLDRVCVDCDPQWSGPLAGHLVDDDDPTAA